MTENEIYYNVFSNIISKTRANSNSRFSRNGVPPLYPVWKWSVVPISLFPNTNSNLQCRAAEDMWNACGSVAIQCSAATSAQTFSMIAGTTSPSENKMVILWKSWILTSSPCSPSSPFLPSSPRAPVSPFSPFGPRWMLSIGRPMTPGGPGGPAGPRGPGSPWNGKKTIKKNSSAGTRIILK